MYLWRKILLTICFLYVGTVTNNAEIKLTIVTSDDERIKLKKVVTKSKRLNNFLKSKNRIVLKIPLEYERALLFAVEIFRMATEASENNESISGAKIYETDLISDNGDLLPLSEEDDIPCYCKICSEYFDRISCDYVDKHIVFFAPEDKGIVCFISKQMVTIGCGCSPSCDIDKYYKTKKCSSWEDIYNELEGMDDALWLLKSSTDLGGTDLCIALKDNDLDQYSESPSDALYEAESLPDVPESTSELTSGVPRSYSTLKIVPNGKGKKSKKSKKDKKDKERSVPDTYVNDPVEEVDQEEKESSCCCIPKCLKSKTAIACYVGIAGIACAGALYYNWPEVASWANSFGSSAAGALKSAATSVSHGCMVAADKTKDFFCNSWKFITGIGSLGFFGSNDQPSHPSCDIPTNEIQPSSNKYVSCSCNIPINEILPNSNKYVSRSCNVPTNEILPSSNKYVSRSCNVPTNEIPSSSNKYVGCSCNVPTNEIPSSSNKYVGCSCNIPTNEIPPSSNKYVSRSCDIPTNEVPPSSNKYVRRSCDIPTNEVPPSSNKYVNCKKYVMCSNDWQCTDINLCKK
ncbi:MAG: hypothetical protein LBB20_03055 [Puniceicoccales bacterium]|jgi:hypothetical protein|nr:hypothetical protein [Puniceicoccales bacterium]